MNVNPGDRFELRIDGHRVVAEVVQVDPPKSDRVINRDGATGEFTTADDVQARPGETETEHR